MTDLEKLEYIHSTLQDVEHIFSQVGPSQVEDEMLTRSIEYVEELREPHLQEQSID